MCGAEVRSTPFTELINKLQGEALKLILETMRLLRQTLRRRIEKIVAEVWCEANKL